MQSELKFIVNPVLFVIDLDRCLLNDVAYRVFDEVVSELPSIDSESFLRARRQREASGGSFDSLKWLEMQHGFGIHQRDQLLKNYIDRVHQMAPDILLSSGARALLTMLQSRSIPHLIMTYGGYDNQVAKLQAAKLETIPYLVVDHKHKAQIISSWWNQSAEYFEVTIDNRLTRSHSVVLIDDKATAFDDLPPEPHARGYWLKSARLLPSQEGVIPANVTTISRLHEIVSLEYPHA